MSPFISVVNSEDEDDPIYILIVDEHGNATTTRDDTDSSEDENDPIIEIFENAVFPDTAHEDRMDMSIQEFHAHSGNVVEAIQCLRRQSTYRVRETHEYMPYYRELLASSVWQIPHGETREDWCYVEIAAHGGDVERAEKCIQRQFETGQYITALQDVFPQFTHEQLLESIST